MHAYTINSSTAEDPETKKAMLLNNLLIINYLHRNKTSLCELSHFYEFNAVMNMSCHDNRIRNNIDKYLTSK